MKYIKKSSGVKLDLAVLAVPKPDPETLPTSIHRAAVSWLDDPCGDFEDMYVEGSPEWEAAAAFRQAHDRWIAHTDLTRWLDAIEAAGLLALADTLGDMGSRLEEVVA